MSSIVISGDTSGAITLAAPAVSGTNTATLPAATGTVMVSGNMPAFSAYLNANQSVSNSTWTKVTLNTKEFDTNNNFDSTTNYRFTPTVAGYYQINACVSSASVSYAQNIWCAIYKNGSSYKQAQQSYSSEIINTGGPSVTAVIYFNGTTDYVELYGYNTASNTPKIGGGPTTYTYMSGALVRAA